jgi:hypothetical protein
MKQYNKGAFKHTTPQNNRSGGFFKEEFERVPLFQAARRFSCVFLSASPKDAARLNHHLSAAGIRVYHAANTDEVEMLLAITSEVFDLKPTSERFRDFVESRLCRASQNC